jgi:hypothetical protein
MACCGLSGCVTAMIMSFVHTDLTRDPRFQNIVGHEVLTRKTLYLFKPGYSTTLPELRDFYVFYGSMEEGVRENFIAKVPPGHPVRLTKAQRRHGIELSEEDLFGEIAIKGSVYPVTIDLNSMSDYPNGWKPIFLKSFVIQE